MAKKSARKTRRRPAPPAPPETDQSLTPRQARFAAEYLVDLNATQAAIRAGYSAAAAAEQGYRLLRNAQIQAAVSAGLRSIIQKPLSEAERVIAEAMRIAYSDLRQAFDDDGNLLKPKDLPDSLAPAISSIEVTDRTLEKGGTERTQRIKTWDKNSALITLARYHKLLTDKVESNNRNTHDFGPDPKDMSDDEIAAELELHLKELKSRKAGA